jgi:hypothetical protein
MIAPRSSGRRRTPMRQACTWLIKAFAPGCPTTLRFWTEKRVAGGRRLTIEFDLNDGKARLRAAELVRTAPTLNLIAVGPTVIRDLTATATDDRLTVEALLVTQ